MGSTVLIPGTNDGTLLIRRTTNGKKLLIGCRACQAGLWQQQQQSAEPPDCHQIWSEGSHQGGVAKNQRIIDL